jgi:hypothetical protein
MVLVGNLMSYLRVKSEFKSVTPDTAFRFNSKDFFFFFVQNLYFCSNLNIVHILIFLHILKIICISIFVQTWKLFIFRICSYIKNVHIWNLFIYEICTNLKIIHISNLFIYETCSYMKNIHIWKLFIFWILKIVHILNFVFNLKIIHISTFVQTWKLFIFRILFKFKRKKKNSKPHGPRPN